MLSCSFFEERVWVSLVVFFWFNEHFFALHGLVSLHALLWFRWSMYLAPYIPLSFCKIWFLLELLNWELLPFFSERLLSPYYRFFLWTCNVLNCSWVWGLVFRWLIWRTLKEQILDIYASGISALFKATIVIVIRFLFTTRVNFYLLSLVLVNFVPTYIWVHSQVEELQPSNIGKRYLINRSFWDEKLSIQVLVTYVIFAPWPFSFKSSIEKLVTVYVQFLILHLLFTGVKLQRLMGHVQFVNVSFHYPSRPTVCLLSSISKKCYLGWKQFLFASFVWHKIT